MKQHRKILGPGLLFLILALVTASSAVMAEEVLVLPGMTVTTEAPEGNDFKTPSSKTTIGREEMDTSGVTSPGDLLRGKAGLTATSDGGSWGGNPVVRSFTKERVVLMSDGIRVNALQPFGAIASLVDMALIERIEIDKGVKSAIYGSGALGGAMNMVSLQARHSPQIKFNAAGSTSSRSVNHGKDAMLRIDASCPTHAMVIGWSGRDYGDYDTPEGEIENSGFKSRAVSGQYRLRLFDNLSLKLNFQDYNVKDVWYPGSRREMFTGNTTVMHSPEQERRLYDLGLEAEIFGADLKFRVYRQNINRTILADSSMWGHDIVIADVDFRSKGFITEVVVPLGETQILTLGVDYWHMLANPARWIAFNDPPLRADPFKDSEMDSYSVYVRDKIITDSWAWLLAARYDRVDGDAAEVGVGLHPKTTGNERSDYAISWSLGGIYNASDLINPYFSLATGFRAADMRERYEQGPRGDGFWIMGDPQVAPERSKSIEIGLKGATDSLSYTLSAHYTRVQDYIAGRPTGGHIVLIGIPIKATENIGEVDILGAECELELYLGNDWFSTAALTLQRGENRADDEPLVQMPPHEVSLGVERRPELGWTFDARLRAVAAQNRVATYFANGTEDTTPGYMTVDTAVGYRFGQHEFRLAVTNLLDKAYHEHLTEGVSGEEPLMPGRNIILSWRGSF